MTNPSTTRLQESVLKLDGKPYLLASEDEVKQIDGIRRRWDVRRVTRQAGDPEPEFSVPLETFNLGAGISYALLPGGYESADGWDLSAPGKALTWPRLATGEAFTGNANVRGWLYYSFATNYLYLLRGGYAIKYEPSAAPASEWPILEIRYFGADRVVGGKWAEYNGAVYVPLIDPTNDTEQEFVELTTIDDAVTEVQALTETGSPTGGTFTVTYDDGVTSTTTGALAFDITAADLQTALRAIPGLELVTVDRTGTTTDFVWTVTMTAVAAAYTASSPATLAVNDSGLTGGTAPAITPSVTTPGVGDEWNEGPNGVVARYFAAWNKPGVGPVLALCYENFVRLNGDDPMTGGDWGTSYPVDNSTYRCTALAVWDRFLIVGKANGLYTFDEQAVAKLETKDLAGVIDNQNFVGMVEVGGFILAPHKNGLLRWAPGRYRFVGAESDGLLEGQVATGWGRYLAVAPFGRIAYTSLTDNYNNTGVVGSLVAPGSDARGPLTPHMHQQFADSAEDIIASTIQSNPPRPGDVVSGADVSAVGTIAWTDPGNIAVEDGEVTATDTGTTHYLKALMPAITRVPDGATVDGVGVTVDVMATPADYPTGETLPGTGANFASVGTNAWTNPGNITLDDGTYATVSTAGQSQGLRASNLGFAIPSLATILGVRVKVQRKASATGANSSSGPLVAGTGATVAGNGTWANPSRVTSDDGSYAQADGYNPGSNPSQNLLATNFGFSIPSDATILGIVAEYKRRGGDPGSVVAVESKVRLLKAGSEVGSNLSDGSNYPLSGSPAYTSRGGSSDLWGGTWTPSDINDAGFGVVIAALIGGFGATNNAQVDSVRITVYYSTPGGRDAQVSLIGDSSTVIGSNKANTSLDWPTSDTDATYGGAADTWGAAPTPDIVNSANFGVIISASVPTTAPTLSVDAIWIEVTYQISDVVDSSVRLVVGGVVSGSNLADTTTRYPGVRTARTWGGPTELWGLTPSVADVNADDFGFVLSAEIVGGIATLYGIATMRIYFTLANGDPGSLLIVIQVDADGITARPYAYELARAGLVVANDPNVGHATSDASLKTSRIFAPSRNTQKAYRSAEFWADLAPEANTPGFEMWASVDDGTPFALLDEDGNTFNAQASGAYEAFFPDTVAAIGRWVQLIPTVPALSGLEVPVSVDLRDITLHGSFAPKMTDYVTAVILLRQSPQFSDASTTRRDAMDQYNELLALCGPRPAGSGPIALHDPETGEDTTCMVTGEPRLLRVQFQNASAPEFVAVVTLRKTPRS